MHIRIYAYAHAYAYAYAYAHACAYIQVFCVRSSKAAREAFEQQQSASVAADTFVPSMHLPQSLPRILHPGSTRAELLPYGSVVRSLVRLPPDGDCLFHGL